MKQPLFVEIDCLPCVFESNLISCSLVLDSQDSISFYTDTGGKNFLYKSGKKKLGLKSKKGNLWHQTEFQELFQRNQFPNPGVPQFYFVNDKKSNHDGMLGRDWFANKVVSIDYTKQKMQVLPESNSNEGGNAPLYFKDNSIGKPTSHLARVEVEIDKDTLSLLLDTGAQAYLSQEIQEATGQKRLVAISFVNASIFKRWQEDHPDWKVFQNGDESFKSKEDIILVPSITIAGKEVGPVAFASREDYNFKNMSALFMDQEIQGAVGGNALALLGTIIIDYPQRELNLPALD